VSDQAIDLVEGVVEARNERGVRVAGEWRNASKFRPVELPAEGTRVRLELDPKGFIKTLEVLDAASAGSARDRDLVGARLAVLGAAAAFGARRPDLKSSDVLRIADTWFAWVQRADQPQEEV
jgi:hypothetical protein